MSDFDETLYLQCREYIKLYLLNEELNKYREYDEFSDEEFPLKLEDVVENNNIKTNILLLEIYNSLMRLKSKRVCDTPTDVVLDDLTAMIRYVSMLQQIEKHSKTNITIKEFIDLKDETKELAEKYNQFFNEIIESDNTDFKNVNKELYW